MVIVFRIITINRANIFRQLLHAFTDANIIQADVNFSFVNEKGVDTGGVSRDAYGSFWTELFEITDERVPCIRVDMGVDDWTAAGRIS